MKAADVNCSPSIHQLHTRLCGIHFLELDSDHTVWVSLEDADLQVAEACEIWQIIKVLSAGRKGLASNMLHDSFSWARLGVTQRPLLACALLDAARFSWPLPAQLTAAGPSNNGRPVESGGAELLLSLGIRT